MEVAMSDRTFRAAKTICDAYNWDLSNLPLQKLLYLSHMVHLGVYGRPLVDGQFQAWDLGPVLPDLYHKVKAYGAGPIPDIFRGDPFPEGSDERASIDAIIAQLKGKRPATLVAITHEDIGAWAKHYQSGLNFIPIPNEDIRQEFDDRRAATAAKRAVPA